MSEEANKELVRSFFATDRASDGKRQCRRTAVSTGATGAGGA